MGEDHHSSNISISEDEGGSEIPLSLDGHCDVIRRLSFGNGNGSSNNDDITMEWDKESTQRSLGWPAHLIENTLEWWAARVHPDDRPRVLASLYRDLNPESNARYWSESYRFRVYDESDSRLPPYNNNNATSSSSSSSSSRRATAAASPTGSPESSSSIITATPLSTTIPNKVAAVADSAAAATTSPTSNKRPTSTKRTSSDDVFQAKLPSSVVPSSSTPPVQSSSAAGESRPGSAHSASPDFPAHAYITVLDQLHITRTSLVTTSSSDTQSINSNINLAATFRPPRSAIGSMAALEQRVKTSEALDSSRARLMRHISSVSTSSTSSSTASVAAGGGAGGESFATAMSSPQQQQQQQHATSTTTAAAAASSAVATASATVASIATSALQSLNNLTTTTSSPTSYHTAESSSASSSSINSNSNSNTTVVTPNGITKAFSFLDVEGVRTVLENTQSGLVMMDSKGFSTYINTACSAITGYENLEDLNAAGLTFHYTLHGKHPDGSEYPMEDCPIVQAVASLERTRNHPDTFWRKDGTSFPVVWSCSPISKLGKAIGAVLEFRDVTEEKALEKDKLKATLMTKHQEITIREANASKQRMTQFLDYIAHELRNPLHGIAANIEFLRDSLTALQATFELPSSRPGATPLQQHESIATPTASISGLSGISTDSQSSLRSSSFRSGTPSSHSSFSHGSSGLRSRSPKLPSSSVAALPSPGGVTAAALSSAILPSKPVQQQQHQQQAQLQSNHNQSLFSTRPAMGGPSDSYDSVASSDTTQGPGARVRSPQRSSPQKASGARRKSQSPPAEQAARPSVTALQQLEESANQLSSLAAGSSRDLNTAYPGVSASSSNTIAPGKHALIAGKRGGQKIPSNNDTTPVPSTAQVPQSMRSNPITTTGTAGVLPHLPPAWHNSHTNTSQATMNMSPLLSDITKHTAHAHVLATQQAEGLEHAVEHSPSHPHPQSAKMGLELSPRKPRSQRISPQPVGELLEGGGGGGSASAKTSHDELRARTKAFPAVADPSPPLTSLSARQLDPISSPMSQSSRLSQYTGTVVGSPENEKAEHTALSSLEIQQVLQTSQSFITSIRECVFHATHITNNVLDLSRFEAGKVELLNDIVYPARVASLAVDMMMARAQEKEIELSLDIPADQTLVRGDGTRLAQVFLNLLSNAIKFTPRGGTVTLRFRVEHVGDKVLLLGSIIDTGMGMSKEEMSNLFQRFGQSSRTIQAEFGGTGLGLTICQEIVTLQEGKMSVESEKGKGSTFSFTAYYQSASDEDVKEYTSKTPGTSRRGSNSPAPSPLTETSEQTVHAAIDAFMPTLTTTLTGQASPTGLPEEQQRRLLSFKRQFEDEQSERIPFKFKHILVAEDNLINQNIMKTYLKKLRYKFTIVANGQEVLDTFVNKTHDEPIDVVLMDCEMPVMDGRQATEHIRQHEHFRKNLVTPLDSPFNLQLGAAEINSLQSSANQSSATPYSPPLTSPGLNHSGSTPTAAAGRRLHRTPIIGLSGNARQELVNQAMASGMDDYVVKPFKLAELDKVLRKWESTIDDQLVHRTITLKAKEFLAANAATLSSPIRSKDSSMTNIALWSNNAGDVAGSSASPTKGLPARPSRPPLKASLSASRLPREHMLSYGSPDRSSRPKLPSRLSNEWVQQVQRRDWSSEASPMDSRLSTITSEPNSPAVVGLGTAEVGYMPPMHGKPELASNPLRTSYRSSATQPIDLVRPPFESTDSSSSTASSQLCRSV